MMPADGTRPVGSSAMRLHHFRKFAEGAMAAIGTTRTSRSPLDMSVHWGEAVMPTYDVNDPGCVKTHTSAKCRKHNSPARHRTSRVQYDLTLSDAIVRRYFYVWRDRWSFRTAKTQLGHRRIAGDALPRCRFDPAASVAF